MYEESVKVTQLLLFQKIYGGKYYHFHSISFLLLFWLHGWGNGGWETSLIKINLNDFFSGDPNLLVVGYWT